MIFFVLGWVKSVDTGHALAKLARMIDLDFLRARLGAVYGACPAARLESPRGAVRASSFDNCLSIQHLQRHGLMGSNI